MSNPKALVLTGDGINCEVETAHALELAGFEASITHISRLLESPDCLDSSRLLVLPGGFSFGDEIASGKVLALKLANRLRESLSAYVASGRLIIGICNGFQALVQMKLLPEPANDKNEKTASLLRNTGRQFINRWVELEVDESRRGDGSFFAGMAGIELPIRHGEGRLFAREGCEAEVTSGGALRYAEDINGSLDRIAALVNKRGNVLGMMPHPEAYVRESQHPAWTRRRLENPEGKAEEPDGLRIFKNARTLA